MASRQRLVGFIGQNLPSRRFPNVQDDILSFEEEKQAAYLQVYRPVYFQLVDVLLYKSHYPPQEDYALWSSDDKEQFRIYRRGQKRRRGVW